MPKHLVIELVVEKTTDKALLCRNPAYEGGDPEWIPRSAVEDGDDVEVRGEPQELAVASWLLNKIGW